MKKSIESGLSMFRRRTPPAPALTVEQRRRLRGAAVQEVLGEARANLAALPPARSIEKCPKCGGSDLVRKLARDHVLAYATVQYPGLDGGPAEDWRVPLTSETLFVTCQCGGLRRWEQTADSDPATAKVYSW